MDVLLLAGYRQDDDALGLSMTDQGLIQLDTQILILKEYGLSPIVVLSGNHADEVLLKSKHLEGCELIFDTHGVDSTMMSMVRSGLYGVDHTAFAIPVEVPCPPKEIWVALRRAFQASGFSTKIAMLQLHDDLGALCHYGFPLFITRLGRHLILNDETIQSLTDPKLKYDYSRLAVDSPSL